MKKCMTKKRCVSPKVFNEKTEECEINIFKCRINEYYSLRMNRCLRKRRCGINEFFNDISEKCVRIIF